MPILNKALALTIAKDSTKSAVIDTIVDGNKALSIGIGLPATSGQFASTPTISLQSSSTDSTAGLDNKFRQLWYMDATSTPVIKLLKSHSSKSQNTTDFF